jgi:hypothetical protein
MSAFNPITSKPSTCQDGRKVLPICSTAEVVPSGAALAAQLGP